MFRKHLFLSFAFAAAIVFLPAAGARAQEHLGYCENITNTSEALACINRHKEDAQIRLNMVFVDLAKTLQEDADSRARLQEAQNAWLSYRDDQCAFEAKRAETTALERIYELSCITNLTEQRAELLAMALFHRAKGQPREFGTFPRWMNVLAHENPQVFWRYGNRAEVDFDCDGQAEEVLSGVTITPGGTAEDPQQSASVVIAISTNPPTGRPQSRLLSFPVGPGAEGVCNPLVSLVPQTGSAAEGESCAASLTVRDGSCFDVTIGWTGTEIGILSPPGPGLPGGGSSQN